MKMFALAGAIVMISASTALAQRVQIEAKPIQLQPRVGVTADAPLMTPDAVEKLKLTAEQSTKYTKIEAEYKEKNKAAQDAYRTVTMGVRDREKFKEALDKMQTDTKKAREDALAKVEPILTGEQKTVFAQVKAQQPNANPGVIRQPIGGIGGGVGQILPAGVQQRLQLTDEQKKQIEALQKEVDAKLMKLLTDEQKKQLEQIKKGPGVRPLPRPVNPANPANPRVLPVQPAQPAVPAIKRD